MEVRDTVKPLLSIEEKDSYRLSGKTGACSSPDGSPIVWLVGFIEKGSNVYFFAMNMGSAPISILAPKRIPVTKAILKQFGLLN